MKIAFIADEITEFVKNHDSTWAIMQAAHSNADQVFYAHCSSLQSKTNQAFANFIHLDDEFFDYQKNHYSRLLKFPVLPLDENDNPNKYPCSLTNLDDFDLVFMRKDPPMDVSYVQACQILSLCKKAKIVNSPQAILNFNEKLSILNFQDLIAPTIVTSEASEIKNFLDEHGQVVIKPLNRMGGQGIFILEKDSANFSSIVETATNAYSSKPDLVMVQKFIPAIEQGDKRIILINGEIVGALLRVADNEDFRANLAAGGSFCKYEPNQRDIEICSKFKKFLLEKFFTLAGIDIIGDYLTEINITSPTCFQEIDLLNNFAGEDTLAARLIKSLRLATTS